MYDRAGLGWSDPAPGLPTATAHELHTLLGNAGIRSPFVLVGHSLGGLVARVFTHLYPTEVAAVGLVDSSHPDEPQRLPKVWLRDHRGGKLAEVALSYIRPLRAAPPDPHTPPHHDGQRADGTWRSHDAEQPSLARLARRLGSARRAHAFMKARMTGQLRTGWAVQDATGDRKEPWRQDAQLLRIIFGIRRVASAPGQHAAGLWLETELMAPRHSVSVTAVVVRSDGRILVIKRVDDGRWVPPGGVLELDETPQDGLVREVLEETGYKVEPERLTGVYKNMRLGVVSLVFRCRNLSI